MDASPAQQAARDRIAAELAAAGFALPGTLTIRVYACGKPNCRCHADPPCLHGPYAEWTRKIDGKTVTRRLTQAELTAWQPLFGNASPQNRRSAPNVKTWPIDQVFSHVPRGLCDWRLLGPGFGLPVAGHCVGALA